MWWWGIVEDGFDHVDRQTDRQRQSQQASKRDIQAHATSHAVSPIYTYLPTTNPNSAVPNPQRSQCHPTNHDAHNRPPASPSPLLFTDSSGATPSSAPPSPQHRADRRQRTNPLRSGVTNRVVWPPTLHTPVHCLVGRGPRFSWVGPLRTNDHCPDAVCRGECAREVGDARERPCGCLSDG